MPDILHLPYDVQFDIMNSHLEKIANTRVQTDYSSAPGSKFLVKGDTQAGFYGFVQAVDFITGDALATALGLTAGTSQNSDCPWIKYHYDGKVCLVPLKTHRHSIDWDSIYNIGAVYGDGSKGVLPPEGRLGTELEITNSNTITTSGHFLGDKTAGTGYYDTVGAPGDTMRLSGWTNGANNTDLVIDTISDTVITFTTSPLVAEVGTRVCKMYDVANEVTQSKTVVVDGLTYRVRLPHGAENDPMDSYANSDRDAIGSEWNKIMLPLHERAKLQNWNYPAYAGTTEYWETNLTDEDLRTHHNFGNGSYSWCQEVRNDDETFRRAARGGYGVSDFLAIGSWSSGSNYGVRFVLELLG